MNTQFLILAGGSGSRLGQVRKAEIRLGGSPLLERVANRLRIDRSALFISTGAGLSMPSAIGTALPDLDTPLGGPLAGIVAAAAHLRHHAPGDSVLLSVAVDTPFLPEDFAARLLAALEHGARAAKACWRGNAYPTNAAWRLADLQDLPEQAAAGTVAQSPRALLAQLGAVSVDWETTHACDPFANLNTISDLLALSHRVQGSSD
ncbi:MAG: molybdenum cofactor guanylyltransferase [Devosia marina]|uniref:molybdenum cofactor guanylyltransferase n=1 Tax=Devosia marina TaxID=2683198 RepID=UPI0032F013C7